MRASWWREARFGLFIHWGLYAIPAGEWNGKTDYGEWIREEAHIPVGEYEGLRERWNPVKFDADAWVSAAKDAGMQYVVITSKHHDGFCLFDSSQTDWDVMSTPMPKDVMKAIADASRKQGLVPCWYHSIMDWHHPDYLPRRGWEVADRPAEGADFDRFERYLHAQVEELLTNYGKIGVMWFDGEWESTWSHERGKRLYELCRRLQPDVLVNNRVDVGRGGMAGFSTDPDAVGDFGTPEQEVPASGIPGLDWESCMTMNRHWGFNARDTDFKSSRELVRTLVDIASKGGNFLLNVGPTAEGEFPPACLERLAAIGAWMKVNGEAIHGTSASPVGAPAWGRITWKSDGGDTRLYCHVFDWPTSGHLDVEGFGNTVLSARLLGEPERELAVEGGPDAYRISVPSAPLHPDVTVVELVLRGAPIPYTAPSIEAVADVFFGSTEVRFVPPSEGLSVRYTLNGSEPTLSAPLATEPVRIWSTTTVTARTFDGKRAVGASATRTLTHAKPAPAAKVENLVPGLLLWTDPGDRKSVHDPRTIVFDGKTPEEMARLEKEFNERVVTAVELPEEDRARERVMLTFLGYVRVPKDGLYEFELESDDGSLLQVGDGFVLDNDGLHSAQKVRGAVALAAGWHAIHLDWFNRTGQTALELKMGPAGGSLRPIEAADLAHAAHLAGAEERAR